MRPPVLPSGNSARCRRRLSATAIGFNEAAGFTQRKLAGPRGDIYGRVRCFNEAAGFTQRKRNSNGFGEWSPTGFNEAAGFTQRKPIALYYYAHMGIAASMRPPVLPSGNSSETTIGNDATPAASMRPPVLPSGNPMRARGVTRYSIRFNEAAGFTQRKPGAGGSGASRRAGCFNEAAGFTQRKRPRWCRSS